MNSKQKYRNSAKYKLQQKRKTEKMNLVAVLRGRAARGGNAGGGGASAEHGAGAATPKEESGSGCSRAPG
jgi:hypothetical protein